MKKLKKMTAESAATLDGPLFSQSRIRKNDRRNAHLVFWYQTEDLVYLLLGFVIDALFLVDSMYRNSLLEAGVGVIGLLVCICVVAHCDRE